ncbi:MAG: 4Fe-4S dicluster domain-containing protein [Desulfovibrionaceae bacterium]|jgi:NAD-dependent dihydropyrimidine dehydrogenase PreA subunit|nr:4Fe-4S dicluster domain-containing protein [Desulfovibrionaceae bacterium]
MAGFLKVLLRNVLQGPSTDPYPLGPTFSPDSIRGKVVVDPTMCIGCGMCVHVCTAGAINIQHNENGHVITIYRNSCCLCANCHLYCPTGAITLTDDWHSAHEQAVKYQQIEQQHIDYEPCLGCGTPVRVMPLALVSKLYAGKPDVDPEHVRHLCPRCRQMEDAVRTYNLQHPEAPASGNDEA